MTSTAPGVQPLTVPERHVAAFGALLEMVEAEFAGLHAALAAAEATDHRGVIAESIRALSGLDASDVNALLDALIGLAALAYRSGATANQIAERVVASPQLAETESRDDRFLDRLKQLLTCNAVRLQSKALSLGASHDRIFVSARIITDLRPIFNDDVAGRPEPEAALLSHILRLHYIASNGQHDNLYVVLDDDDIEVLQEALGRAREKADSLVRTLYESGIVYMTWED